MNKKTLQITTGGALVAIFAMILLMNRQTGGFFQEMFVYILPIPMVAYASRFGWKSGVPVMISMILISLIFGNITTIYYTATQALIGLVFGGCINRRMDMTKTMFLVMFLSALSAVTNSVVLASLFGMDLKETINELQVMMNTVFDRYSSMSNMPEDQILLLRETFNEAFLTRIFVFSMVLFGGIQGFLIFELSLILLNRLKLPVPKPRSVFTFFPPRESEWIAVALFCCYALGLYRMLSEPMATIFQSFGILAQMYLSLFGFLGVMLWMRIRFPKRRVLGVLAALGCYLILPFLEIIIGVMYVEGTWHRRWLEQAQIAINE